MARNFDSRKQMFDDVELAPKTLLTVPVGTDGQLAVVTDNPGVRLMVREGGVLVPAIDAATVDVTNKVDQTTTSITLNVDPVGGTTPPAGLIVHSQAEYDALGYSLLRPQDAIDILPIGIGHSIIVRMLAGNHLAKVGSSGRPTFHYALITKAFIDTSDKTQQDISITGWLFKSMIIFKGVTKTIAYSGSGAWTGSGTGVISGITPGGMTPDAYIGKLLIITTGANAGTYMPIRTNGIDSITGPPMPTYLALGACTFDVYDPAATLLPSTDGITMNATSGILSPLSTVRVSVENIKIGTDAMPNLTIRMGSYFPLISHYIFGCQMVSASVGAYAGGRLNVWWTDIKLVGAAYAGAHNINDGVSLYMTGCTLRGVSSANFLYAANGGALFIGNTAITPNAGVTASIFHLDWGLLNILAQVNIYGNGLCTGLTVSDIGQWGAPSTVAYGLIWMDNCATMFSILGTAGLYLEKNIHSSCGATNLVGWRVSAGSKVLSDNFTTTQPMLTSDIIIDGVAASFSSLTVAGDELVGQYGSRMIRHG
jgi:hypothetical protein